MLLSAWMISLQKFIYVFQLFILNVYMGQRANARMEIMSCKADCARSLKTAALNILKMNVWALSPYLLVISSTMVEQQYVVDFLQEILRTSKNPLLFSHRTLPQLSWPQ